MTAGKFGQIPTTGFSLTVAVVGDETDNDDLDIGFTLFYTKTVPCEVWEFEQGKSANC